MMLAFGIDQLQRRAARCSGWRWSASGVRRASGEDFRSLFATFLLPDWDTFHRALAFGHEAPVPVPFDTS